MPITYSQWQEYPWKNELTLQAERVCIHFAECLSDEFEGEHIPLHMLDRALVLAAFVVRRMFEKRLVTDKLGTETFEIRLFRAHEDPNFRRPFVGYSGGDVFENYDIERADSVAMKIYDLANEIVHSSQVMVVYDEVVVPTGLLIASDWHQKDRVLHLTIDEFDAIVKRVLDDRITTVSDQRDLKTGTVKALRL